MAPLFGFIAPQPALPSPVVVRLFDASAFHIAKSAFHRRCCWALSEKESLPPKRWDGLRWPHEDESLQPSELVARAGCHRGPALDGVGPCFCNDEEEEPTGGSGGAAATGSSICRKRVSQQGMVGRGPRSSDEAGQGPGALCMITGRSCSSFGGFTTRRLSRGTSTVR